MKRILLPALAAIAALSLSSCFQSETVIHLNKDGSGTIVEETTLGAQMVAMMSGLGGQGADAKDPMAEMFSEEKAKEKLPSLGEGVTFVKAEKIDAGGKKGGRVTYKFADINKLKMNADGGASSLADSAPAPEEAKDAVKKEPITFTYAANKLTIKLPQPEAKKPAAADAPKAEEAAEAEANPQAEMMKTMMADMHFTIKVVADGGISETSATYAEGDTLTLMDMDFGKIVKNEAAFKKMQTLDQSDPDAFKEAFKDVPGLKIETKKEVTATLK